MCFQEPAFESQFAWITQIERVQHKQPDIELFKFVKFAQP